jgi:hypothetical protein
MSGSRAQELPPSVGRRVGGATAPSQAGFGVFCSLRNDTYVDIGRAASDSGDGVTLTPDFQIGATAMTTINGGWGRVPGDPLTRAGGDGRVFFGQFTVPADAPPLLGMANLTMHEDGDNGTHFGVIFTDTDAEPSPVVADVDGDLNIDVDDIILVIVGWGPCEACPGECVECYCAPDVNEDGTIDGTDLIDVLLQYGSL